MAYSPVTDFLALLRQTGGGVRTARVPGLDYVVSALARAGMFQISVGQVAPTANQQTTIWVKPAPQSWSAESAIFLWNPNSAEYEPASSALWGQLASANTTTNFVTLTAFGTGTYAARPLDDVILLKAGIGAPFAITIDWSLRTKPLTIVDSGLNALANNVRISPSAGQTQMGVVNYTYVIDSSGASITLRPLPDYSGAY
jgi:hypothetical protein